MGKCLGRRWGHVIFGSHGTCTTAIARKKKIAENNRACAEHTFGSGDFRTGSLPVTSLPVKKSHWDGYCATSGCACAEPTSR